MKKQIYFLVSLFALIGFSLNVSAQSTGTTPYPGATHHYKVNNGVKGTSTYVWSVLNNALSDVSSTDVTITPSDANVTILWKSTVTAGAVYYVKVVETNGSCTNTKAFKVTIAASNFDVVADATAPCWTEVTLDVDGTSKDPIYKHGTATIAYTFTPTNNQGAYKFTYSIPTVSGFSWAKPTFTAGTGNLDAAATGNAGTFTTTGTGNVTLTFVVTRTDTNNGDIDGSAADFNSDLSFSDVKTGDGFTISESTAGQTNNSKNISVARPHTSNIVPVD